MSIIPNWHPVFVHFTVASLTLAVVFYLLARVFGSESLRQQWRIVANWLLWSGVALTLITVLTGGYAFNTVQHDDPSHLVMKEHRLLALTTFLVFLGLAVWAFMLQRGGKSLNGLFIGLALIGVVILGSTAWHGGELVYRHGLGVISLPQKSAHMHGDADHH